MPCSVKGFEIGFEKDVGANLAPGGVGQNRVGLEWSGCGLFAWLPGFAGAKMICRCLCSNLSWYEAAKKRNETAVQWKRKSHVADHRTIGFLCRARGCSGCVSASQTKAGNANV